MLLINCPHCGPRAEVEFRWGGQAHLARPGPAEAVSDIDWAAYLFDRLNPDGEHHERWCHGAGCGQWFNLVRCTRSHRIMAVYPMGVSAP